MATPNEDQAAAVTSTYQVTHYRRPADRSGWSQVTSAADLAATDAVLFIHDSEEAFQAAIAPPPLVDDGISGNDSAGALTAADMREVESAAEQPAPPSGDG